jgi:hypothetical protein
MGGLLGLQRARLARKGPRQEASFAPDLRVQWNAIRWPFEKCLRAKNGRLLFERAVNLPEDVFVHLRILPRYTDPQIKRAAGTCPRLSELCWIGFW